MILHLQFPQIEELPFEENILDALNESLEIQRSAELDAAICLQNRLLDCRPKYSSYDRLYLLPDLGNQEQ